MKLYGILYTHAKGVIHSNFNSKQLCPKYQFITELPKFHILTKIVILKLQLERSRDKSTDFTLYVLWQGHGKNLFFFIFGSCEPITREFHALFCNRSSRQLIPIQTTELHQFSQETWNSWVTLIIVHAIPMLW